MNFLFSVQLHIFFVSYLVLISSASTSRREIHQRHTSIHNKELPEQHHKSVPCKLPSPIHQHLQQLSGSPHRSCNLTTALETTYYAKFNYTGPIAQGLTCYAVYKCDGHVETLSPTCDAFVYYLLYMEAYELAIRAMANSKNCDVSPQWDPIWTPDSGIFNYKELVFYRDGKVTIRQRQRLKLFSDLTMNQLTDTDYATLNKKYPRDELKKWSTNFYVYNGTVYDINGNEFTEREQCVKSNETWTCDTKEHPNQAIVDEIPWHMGYFDALSGYTRIQFFLENKNINRTGYHGMDGDGWNVTDTVITGEMAGPNWYDEAAKRLLFFDKLWVEGCRCQNKLQPGENMVTKCEQWYLMKRNFYIPFKPAGLSYCPNMDHLNIPPDAFEEV